MKLTKTQWIVVAIVGAILVWYFLLRKKDTKKEESGLTGGYDPKKDIKKGGVGGTQQPSGFGIQECKMLANNVVASSNTFPCHYPNSKKLAYESTY